MTDRVMVVTGASSGVGREIVLTFARQGYLVFAVARGKEKLRQLANDFPDNIVPTPCNIADAGEVKRTINGIIEDYESIDVLVNNAASFAMQEFVEQDVETIDRLIDTNLKGLMYVTQFALPALLRANGAHIINVASVAGTHGIPQQAIYCASKHGVVGFGDALAQELVDQGVNVVTLCPGGIKTPLWTTGENPYPGNVDDLMAPEEIAGLVDFVLKQPKGTLYKRMVFFPTNEWH